MQKTLVVCITLCIGNQSVKGYIAFNNKNIFTKANLDNFYISYNNVNASISGILQANLYPKFFVEGYLNASSIKAPLCKC